MKFLSLAVATITAASHLLLVAEAHNIRERPREKRHSNIRAKSKVKVRNGSKVVGKGEHQEESRGKPAKRWDEDDGPQTIIGGTQSNENEFPYYLDTASCGGSMIAPKVVLTAAHCGESYYGGKRVIVNGFQRGYQGTHGIIREVAQVVPHPGYNPQNMENDFELYLLTEAVPGTSVNLALNTDPSYPSDGTDVTVLGIGMQNENGGIVNGEFLYDVVIPIVNFQQCSNAWGGFLNMDLMVCAGTVGKGACMGDSGGPLVVRNGNTHTQVGVVSFGANNECAKHSAEENVFARTSGAINWIRTVVCDEWNESASFCDGNTSDGDDNTSGGDDNTSDGSGCTDLADWQDSYGDDCSFYVDYFDDMVCTIYGDDEGTNGKTPKDACCVCKP